MTRRLTWIFSLVLFCGCPPIANQQPDPTADQQYGSIVTQGLSSQIGGENNTSDNGDGSALAQTADPEKVYTETQPAPQRLIQCGSDCACWRDRLKRAQAIASSDAEFCKTAALDNLKSRQAAWDVQHQNQCDIQQQKNCLPACPDSPTPGLCTVGCHSDYALCMRNKQGRPSSVDKNSDIVESKCGLARMSLADKDWLESRVESACEPLR